MTGSLIVHIFLVVKMFRSVYAYISLFVAGTVLAEGKLITCAFALNLVIIIIT